MRIIVTTVQVPFVFGGAEFHATNLKNALLQRGHEAEIVTMPFAESPVNMIEDHIVAARLFDLNKCWAGDVELCIGLKFPAYFMLHDNKVIWALHQYRAAYELYDTEYSSLKKEPHGETIRKIIKTADELYLKEAKRIYANSSNVANRMYTYNQLKAQPLYHPCPDMEKFYVADYDNYILMPSRINMTKRQLLAIEAMACTTSDINLYIMGSADHEHDKERMMNKIREYRLQNKVKYLGAVSQEEKFKLYANARAILFIPYDEDYGYITLESMSSSKAVITTIDSGGPLEFVEDGRNGVVVKPNAECIAKAIDEFAKSTEMAISLGEKARTHIRELNITWENVVKELTKK